MLTNLAVVSNDSDDDGDPLNIVAIGGQSVSPGGSVTLASGAIVTLNLDGTLDYDQNGAFDSLNVGESGQETFTYSVSDGLVSSNATVTVTVNGAFDNAAPDAQNDALSTDEDQATSGNVLSNDSDTDGDALTVTAVNGSGVNVGNQITLSSGALLTMNSDGSYDYDPNGAFDSLEDGQNGNDSFSYTIADGFGGSDTATVNVTINGVSPPTTTQPLLIDFEGETQGIYPGEGGLDFAGLNVVLTNGLSGAQAGSSGSDGDFTITASGEDFDLNSLSAIVSSGRTKVRIDAYDDGVLVGTQQINVGARRPSDVSFDTTFDSIDQVVFTADGEFFIDDIALVTRSAIDPGGKVHPRSSMAVRFIAPVGAVTIMAPPYPAGDPEA